MLKKIFIIFIIFITITLLVGICESVNATNENIVIEKTVTNYEQLSSEKGGEVVLKVSNMVLNSNASYKYQLKYNELETQWYDISDIDFENNVLNITLEKAKADILSILKITDVAYLTIQEIDENLNRQNLLENKKIDVKLPLSKAFQVNHNVNASGYHGIKQPYGLNNILFQYVKVDNENVLRSYLEYLENYDSSRDEIYWGYYVDNLIDTLDIEKDLPKNNWRVLPENGVTDIQPTEKGLYFIWMKVQYTEANKEIIGCVFSNRFSDISILEKQLEDTVESNKKLNATVSYEPNSNTTGNVVATIKTNKKVNKIEGWTLSDDGKTLTKTYSTNTTETVHLVDLDRMTKDVEIKITNIVSATSKSDNEKDTTTAKGTLPQAGVSSAIIISLIAIIIISIITYKRYNSYKDIK